MSLGIYEWKYVLFVIIFNDLLEDFFFYYYKFGFYRDEGFGFKRGFVR